MTACSQRNRTFWSLFLQSRDSADGGRGGTGATGFTSLRNTTCSSRTALGLRAPRQSPLLLPALAAARGLQPPRGKSNRSPDASHMPATYAACSQRSERKEPFLWERNHNNTPVPAPARGGKCVINICRHGERKREQAMHTDTTLPCVTPPDSHAPAPSGHPTACALSVPLQLSLMDRAAGPHSEVSSQPPGACRAAGTRRVLPSTEEQKGRGKPCSTLNHGFSAAAADASEAAGSCESVALIAGCQWSSTGKLITGRASLCALIRDLVFMSCSD